MEISKYLRRYQNLQQLRYLTSHCFLNAALHYLGHYFLPPLMIPESTAWRQMLARQVKTNGKADGNFEGMNVAVDSQYH